MRSLADIQPFDPTGTDAVAAVLIAAGAVCQLLQRRLPPLLGTSLFVGAASVGIIIASLDHAWFARDEWLIAARVSAVLCVVWALFGRLGAPRPSGVRSSNGTGAPAASPTPASPLPASSAVFYVWALLFGIIVVVLTAYPILIESSSRLLNPNRPVLRLDDSGLWNLSALLVASLIWGLAAQRSLLPTFALLLGAGLIVWTGLMIPSAIGSSERTALLLPSFQPPWWSWSLHMQMGLALLLLIASVLQESRYRDRRRRAWPDRLHHLLEPYSRWPGYIQGEAVIAAAVLLLGVYHLVREGPPHWQLAIANCAAAQIAGWTCLFMTYRRWSANTAGLGISLLTLAVVSLACAPALGAAGPSPTAEYAARIPVIYNAALFALALMIACWSWLAGVWEQQLLDGIPWTTTGRLIPHARRAAYLLTAIAVLIAYQMAVWPGRVLTGVEDNTPGRIASGVVALLLLTLVSAHNARRMKNETSASLAASLSITFVIVAAAFVFVRLPASSHRGWVKQHDAIVLSALALPLLILAEVLPKSRWRCFAMPLWWLALLALPAAAMLELLTDRRPAAEWIQPATFGLLGVLYLFAGRAEHRRAMLVLGTVLLLASLTSLLQKNSLSIL